MRFPACLIAFFVLVPPAVSTPDDADLVVTGSRVWTGNPRQPWAEAIAVGRDRIAAVGTAEEIRKQVGSKTLILDAAGALVTPGFTDCHTHIRNRTPAVTPITLRFVRTKQRFIERVGGYAAKAPKRAWLLGGDWDHRQWGGELPSRHWIDSATPDTPVWLYHVRNEMALANSAALRAAGITRETVENPPGGIDRDSRGEPTGIVRLSAMSLVDAAVEAPDRETSDAALDDVMRRLTEWGVTSIHNMTGWEQLLILRRARATGRLRVRVYAAITPLESWKRLVEYTSVNGQGDEWLRWSAMKGYARDWPDSGAGTNPPPAESVPGETTIEQFYEWVAAASRARLPILVHDGGGVRQVLDVFARVRAEQQIADPRFRMEHSFFVTPSDAKRFAALGVIGSLQPDLAFTFDDPVEFQDHLPYRVLLDSGARVAFGSDQIAAPLAGIALAMTHPIAAGPVMTVEEALRAYTSDAAYAAFEEKDKGTLEPGKLADFVILDQDITRVAPNQIRATRVVVTVVGGRIVYHWTKPGMTGGTPDGTLAPNEWRQ